MEVFTSAELPGQKAAVYSRCAIAIYTWGSCTEPLTRSLHIPDTSILPTAAQQCTLQSNTKLSVDNHIGPVFIVEKHVGYPHFSDS